VELLLLVLAVALPGRDDGCCRDEGRAFADAGEQLLEQAGLLDLDCDVVDPAAVAVASRP
jgi:hypothetical protein